MGLSTFSFRSALILGGTLAVACSSRPDPNTGAVVVSPPGTRAADVAARGAFDLDRVDPAFTHAVSLYAREVNRLRVVPEADRQKGIPEAITLLADAIAAAPHATGNEVATSGVQVMRVDEHAIEMAAPAQPPLWYSVRALHAGGAALGALAGGPYANDARVVARAHDLALALVPLRNQDELRVSREELLDALQRAALVLTAMHTSLATGKVG